MANGSKIPSHPQHTCSPKSLYQPTPPSSPIPSWGPTHILSSVSPPRPSFPETSGWKDAPGSGAVIRRLWPQGSLGLLAGIPWL